MEKQSEKEQERRRESSQRKVWRCQGREMEHISRIAKRWQRRSMKIIGNSLLKNGTAIDENKNNCHIVCANVAMDERWQRERAQRMNE